jgi:hypothetical protein
MNRYFGVSTNADFSEIVTVPQMSDPMILGMLERHEERFWDIWVKKGIPLTKIV